jgi:ABC-type transport system involved in multi-copper enzyme maturation permease subunit
VRLFKAGRLESPIFNRELKSLLRSKRSFLWMTVYLAVLIIALSIAWSNADFRYRDQAARALFTSLAISQIILFSFLAPVLTSGSISGEHERRTFGLLATTPLTGYHISLAKCFSALVYVLMLVVASIPVISVTFLIGGVGWYEVLSAAIVIVVTVLVSGMIGVACSAWTRRTYLALMLSFAVVGAELFFVAAGTGMASGFFLAFSSLFWMGGGGGEAFAYLSVAFIYSVIQSVMFVGIMHLARNGYLAGTRTPPPRPKRMIRSRKVLKERSRRFPYYLIDPLKAPQPIPDGANPMYVRDKRHNPLGRMDFVIRISYICMFISIFMGLLILSVSYLGSARIELREMFGALVKTSFLGAAILLIVIPLYASTAFTSEKENGTFVTMMSTMIPAHQVLWAKLRIILRYSLFLLFALYAPAFFEMFFQKSGAMTFLISLLMLAPFYLAVILITGLIGLLFSTRTDGNIRSLTLTYLTLIALCFGPWLLEAFARSFTLNFGMRMQAAGAWTGFFQNAGIVLRGLIQTLAPLFSPFYFLGSEQSWISASNCFETPVSLAFYIAFAGAVIVLLFVYTLYRLQQAVSLDTQRGGSA